MTWIQSTLHYRYITISAALLMANVGPVVEQPQSLSGSGTASPSPANVVIDITTSERWMHGRQSPSFTPWDLSTSWVDVDSATPGTGGSRVLAMRFRDSFVGRTKASVTVDSRGRVLNVATHAPVEKSPEPRLFTDHEELLQRFVDGEFVTLPPSRVWDVLPVLAPRRTGARGSWRDTIDLRASKGLYSQRLTGVRFSTIIGDTIVAGRRYPLVHDSAAVQYLERSERQARTLDTFVVVERNVRGSIVGRYLLDPLARVFVVRDDTTRLKGAARLKYPDGRSFRTPAVFERTRHLATYSHGAYDSLSADRSAHEAQFSIIERPEGVAERVALGDTRVEDSLMAALSTSRNSSQREEIHRLIERWSRKPALDQAMEAEAIANGDLVFALSTANKRWRRHTREPIDLAAMRQLLRVLADPGYAFSLGIQPDEYYEATDALLRYPPATLSDSAGWPCSPAACRLLAAQRQRATEPRLRALALVAQVVLDPTSMCDSVFATDRHMPMLTGAQTLAIATSDRRCGTESGILPERHAGWREWNRWLRQTREWLYSPRVASGDSRLQSDSISLFRMAERVSGRKLESEWQTSFDQAPSDSAREVFGTLLGIMGVVGESSARVASRVQSSVETERRLGIEEMLTLLPVQAHDADSVLAEEVVQTLLAAVLDGSKSWPLLHPSMAKDSAWYSPHRVVQALDGAYGPQEKPISEPIILYRKGVPPGVLATMRRRGVQIVDSGFALPSNVSALKLVITTPQAIGPFVMVSLTHYHEGARIGGRGQSWASGSTYYLLRTDDGLKIVTASTWIT